MVSFCNSLFVVGWSDFPSHLRNMMMLMTQMMRRSKKKKKKHHSNLNGEPCLCLDVSCVHACPCFPCLHIISGTCRNWWQKFQLLPSPVLLPSEQKGWKFGTEFDVRNYAFGIVLGGVPVGSPTLTGDFV